MLNEIIRAIPFHVKLTGQGHINRADAHRSVSRSHNVSANTPHPTVDGSLSSAHKHRLSLPHKSIEHVIPLLLSKLGRDVERVVALNDVTTPEALSYIDYRLERLGVPKMLSKAGAREGDVIWIGEFSFEYSPDL